MTNVLNPSHNYSLEAIPAAFALGLVPHCWYQVRLMAATRGQQSNAMPRTNLDIWKGRLPNELWNHLSRLRGAHLNSMEVFPLFAAAMVAGNVAGLPARDLNNAALSFIGARTLYVGLYATVSHNVVAYGRSMVYAWSIGIPMLTLWRAGKRMSSSD